MSAGLYNITIDQGSDWTEVLVIKENGVPKDITGYSARMQMRKTSTSPTITATFTAIVTNAAGGEVTMSLGHALSSAVTPIMYHYDLEIFTAGDANVTRVLQGTVNLTAEVTQ